MSGAVDRNPRTIWMDGRPHPSPLARHTAAGFSTGTWQGEALLVTTTHLTEGVLSHNGVPSSNQATIREYIVRRGDHLMITMIVYDPIYLEEPYSGAGRGSTILDPGPARTVRARIGACAAGWRGAALPARNESLPRRTDGEVQHSTRCAPWRRGRAVPEYRKGLRDRYVPRRAHRSLPRKAPAREHALLLQFPPASGSVFSSPPPAPPVELSRVAGSGPRPCANARSSERELVNMPDIPKFPS